MAFPTSPSNNDVHKEGNRAFVYDSTTGTWDQIRQVERGFSQDSSVPGGTSYADVSGVPMGSLINFGYVQDDVRSTIGRGYEAIFRNLNFQFNKKFRDSMIVVIATIIGRDDQDGHCGTGFKFGGSNPVWCGSYTYDAGNYMTLVSISGVLKGHTTTGFQPVRAMYGSKSGGTLAPFQIMNPNNTDTTEFTAGITNKSTLLVWEVLGEGGKQGV